MNSSSDYLQSCQRCEHEIVIDAGMRDDLLPVLYYDHRDRGGRGRCLMQAIPSLGLNSGDRLTEERGLSDVANLDRLLLFPRPIVFWRSADEDFTRHRNPVFAIHLGTTPDRCLTVDILHCLNLGVMHNFCFHVMWLLLMSGAWGRSSTLVETANVAMLACSHELKKFYKKQRQSGSREKLTEIKRFGKRQLGKHDDRHLRSKGAETFGLLLFLVEQLRAHLVFLGEEAPRLLAAAEALVLLVRTWEQAPLFCAWRIIRNISHHGSPCWTRLQISSTCKSQSGI